SWLKPKAANLYPTIAAARVLDISVRQIPPEITGAIKTIAFIAREWIGDEALARQRVVSKIPFRQMATAKINLAELADATDRLGLIQDEQLNICDSFSQRQDLFGGFWSSVIFRNVIADRPLRFGRAK